MTFDSDAFSAHTYGEHECREQKGGADPGTTLSRVGTRRFEQGARVAEVARESLILSPLSERLWGPHRTHRRGYPLVSKPRSEP